MEALSFSEKNSLSFFSKANAPFHEVGRKLNGLEEKDQTDNDTDNSHLGEIDMLCEASIDVVNPRFNSLAKGFYAY